MVEPQISNLIVGVQFSVSAPTRISRSYAPLTQMGECRDESEVAGSSPAGRATGYQAFLIVHNQIKCVRCDLSERYSRSVS